MPNTFPPRICTRTETPSDSTEPASFLRMANTSNLIKGSMLVRMHKRETAGVLPYTVDTTYVPSYAHL